MMVDGLERLTVLALAEPMPVSSMSRVVPEIGARQTRPCSGVEHRFPLPWSSDHR